MEPSRPDGRFRRLLWVAAVLVCAASLARLAGVAAVQLTAPFDLVYETPNLRTIQLLRQGRPIYDAAVYQQQPWWITPYTPLYHRLVALFPPHPTNPFLPGRLVSMTCMLLAAGTAFLVGGRTVPVSLLAFGLFFAIDPVVSNTPYLKNDPLALLLSALLLNLYSGGLSHPLPGTLCINDVLLYQQLWKSGRLDPAPVIASIQRQQFDGVLVPTGLIEGPRGYYPDAMVNALGEQYRAGFTHGPLTILLRRPDNG